MLFTGLWRFSFMALNAFCRWRHKITKKIPYLQALQDFFSEKMHFCTYSRFEAAEKVLSGSPKILIFGESGGDSAPHDAERHQ